MPVKTIHVPTMGDSITEGTIVDIPVAPGDYVNEDDVVLVLETDKVSVDVRASEGGVVVEILGEVDDVVEVGSALYRLDTDAVAPAAAVSDAPKTASSKVDNAAAVEEVTPSIVAATPAASNIAPPAAAPKKATTAPPPTTAPAMDFITTSLGNRPERRSKMSRMR
jgi:2-oxoglutarate dehydrogenase E2 component (dihydrolipoamide succinyltransferase)